MERMLGAIARGRYWPIRSDARKSCLYFEDAARALVLASLSKEARGGTFLVAPPRSITVSELQQAAYRAVGRRMPPELPLRPVLWTSTLAQRGAEALFGHSMGLVSSIQTLVGPAAYDGSRFARWTGFVPDVPLLEGLRRTADSLQSRP
jgi:nucleoside-diphosphate-sugar epimerase